MVNKWQKNEIKLITLNKIRTVCLSREHDTNMIKRTNSYLYTEYFHYI